MKRQTLRCCGTYEVGGGYPDEVLGVKGKNGTARELGSSELENAEYKALLRGERKLGIWATGYDKEPLTGLPHGLLWVTLC
ncbi:hypothetical protein EV1_035010 [Malus domestica]